jgi:hypothetical protein
LKAGSKFHEKPRARKKHAAPKPKPRELRERFFNKTVQDGDCLIWLGTTNGEGYGRAYIGTRRVYAHRLAWLLAGKPLAKGKELHHAVCRNTLCVNAAHLRVISKAQHARIHARENRRLACPHGHSLTDPDNVIIRVSREGWVRHYCRECKRISDRRVYLAKTA